MTIGDGLDFESIAIRPVITLFGSQDTFLKHAAVLLRIPVILYPASPYVKWFLGLYINVWLRIRFRPRWERSTFNTASISLSTATHNGIWKNMRALGLARRLLLEVSWSSPCLVGKM
jgi:hypothetical protein